MSYFVPRDSTRAPFLQLLVGSLPVFMVIVILLVSDVQALAIQASVGDLIIPMNMNNFIFVNSSPSVIAGPQRKSTIELLSGTGKLGIWPCCGT